MRVALSARDSTIAPSPWVWHRGCVLMRPIESPGLSPNRLMLSDEVIARRAHLGILGAMPAESRSHAAPASFFDHVFGVGALGADLALCGRPHLQMARNAYTGRGLFRHGAAERPVLSDR